MLTRLGGSLLEQRRWLYVLLSLLLPRQRETLQASPCLTVFSPADHDHLAVQHPPACSKLLQPETAEAGAAYNGHAGRVCECVPFSPFSPSFSSQTDVSTRTVVSFFSYRYFRSYTYYSVAVVAYESLVLAAFLMLLLQYIGESTDAQKEVLRGKEKNKIPFPFWCVRYRPSKPCESRFIF
jgi:hypothetical protein